MQHETFQLHKIQMAYYRPLFTPTCLKSGKSMMLDSQTTAMKLNVRFQEGISSKKFNLIKFKMADFLPLVVLICIISNKPWWLSRPSL